MKILKTLSIGIFATLLLASCNNEKPAAEPQPEATTAATAETTTAATPGANNQTIQTILTRKSVREFTGQKISQENIQLLLKAAMAAPSSQDRRPWHFIVVSDSTLLQDLGGKLRNAAMLKNADKAIIVCGDSNVSENSWYIDGSAATQNILLAAESMGLGATWTAVFPYEDRTKIVTETFSLPENMKPLCVIPLGYPAGDNKPKYKFDASRIHYNAFK